MKAQHYHQMVEELTLRENLGNVMEICRLLQHQQQILDEPHFRNLRQ